jgi:hypothetical protein
MVGVLMVVAGSVQMEWVEWVEEVRSSGGVKEQEGGGTDVRQRLGAVPVVML